MFASKYDIIAVYRSQPPAIATQEQTLVDPLRPSTNLPENASPVFAIKADFADDRQHTRVVELALAHSGRIDLLANVAAWSVWAPLMESDQLLDSMRDQFQINCIAPTKLACAVARLFWQDRMHDNIASNRNIVNLSSIAGINVYPDGGQSVYGATKAALNHLTYHMASEFWSIGVRVNAIAPNSFPGIVPLAGVARSIVQLDEASVTGKIRVIDRHEDYYL